MKHMQKIKKTLSSAVSASLSRLGSRVAYTGAGRSSIFAKQANLRKAAKGSRDITSFFAKKVHVKSSEPATVCQHDVSTVSESSDIEPMQTEHTLDSSLASITHKQQQDVNPERIHSSAQTANLQDALSESKQLDLTEFLDITADDEDELPSQPPLCDVVTKLIGEAKRHQSFPALFKLQAVKNYLELLNRYRHLL
jgi:hypothetical protein